MSNLWQHTLCLWCLLLFEMSDFDAYPYTQYLQTTNIQ